MWRKTNLEGQLVKTKTITYVNIFGLITPLGTWPLGTCAYTRE